MREQRVSSAPNYSYHHQRGHAEIPLCFVVSLAPRRQRVDTVVGKQPTAKWFRRQAIQFGGGREISLGTRGGRFDWAVCAPLVVARKHKHFAGAAIVCVCVYVPF